jgi:hypothetical protein
MAAAPCSVSIVTLPSSRVRLLSPGSAINVGLRLL